jgi:threonine dehydrogenase-like Zn-dependent dehydrogenase
MLALVRDEARVRLTDTWPAPTPGPDEVLVRITCAGICGTDLAIADGYAEFTGVLGHEFVGVVETDGPWRGRRVAVGINVGCGACRRCLGPGPEHCARRQVLGIRGRDGGFAEYTAVPARNLHAVPDDVADARAVFAEPLAAALRVAEQIQIRPSLRVAVLGPGRLGSLIAAVLARAGADVTAVGRRESSLAVARRWGLATAAIEDVAGADFDVVVDATGHRDGFARAAAAVRPEGTIVVKSTCGVPAAVDLDSVVVRELRVIGSRCGPMAAALRALHTDGAWRDRLDDLIDARFALADGVAALARAAEPGVRKVLLLP